MKIVRKNKRLYSGLIVIIFVFLIYMPAIALSADIYKFERLWPTLQQPWYFNTPMGMAIDNNGYVYVADTANNCIKKLKSDGQFVTKWGSQGSGDGQFVSPIGIAVDSFGNVYVADSGNNRIQKFDSDGKFLDKWGSFCSLYHMDGSYNGAGCYDTDGPGPLQSGEKQFYSPQGIAVDSLGNVYVADSENNRIQKFDSDGKFLAKWGSLCRLYRYNSSTGTYEYDGTGCVDPDGPGYPLQSGDLQFSNPRGIAVDSAGNVYVVDMANHRIQKFNSDRQFVTKWGSYGVGATNLNNPQGIAVFNFLGIDFLLVSDSFNYRVQMFDSQGVLFFGWGSQGSGDGQFYSPGGIAVDNFGFVYVSESNSQVQKFWGGIFIDRWKSFGNKNGEFNFSTGVAIDSAGNVYVADSFNNRIQKFNQDGQFVKQWGSYCMIGNPNSGCDMSAPGALASGDGQFDGPFGIAVNGGYVYVVDRWNHRVQKFTTDGVFQAKQGNRGSFDGQFDSPNSIAVDSSGYVYVADWNNRRVQKFNSNLQYQNIQWGGYGINALANGIGVDNSGFVYVAFENRIQKFNSNGQFAGIEWGGSCVLDAGTSCVDPDGPSGPLQSGDGQFYNPFGITFDSDGNVYIADAGNNRIQKFTSSGQFLSKFGKFGSGPGLFSSPMYLANKDDKIYISDMANNRVQVIKKLNISANNKAIVVAGGGPYAGNKLWEATQTAANFAYWTLMNQGFSSDRIYYLSSDKAKNLDLDGDKISDIDDYAKNTNMQAAINWATDADNLFVYLVDHGGVDQSGIGTFRMNESEMLSASQLDSWLDTYQDQTCPTSYLMNESFEYGLPIGWTVVDNAVSGAVWRFDDPHVPSRGNQTGGSGKFAIADSDYAGAVNMNTELRTPVLNMSNMSTVKLEFKTDFYYYSSGGAEVADVDVSINGGVNWSNVWRKTGADYRGPKTEIVDIPSAALQNNVMIRFHYYNANNDWWWQIDDVKISGTITSNILAQSFENGLPSGWAVVDNAVSGAVWRFDDPHVPSRGNQTGGSGKFAIADSDYAGAVNMNTELRTPVMNLSNMSTVKLEFKTDFYYYPDGGNEVADVDVSLNGGGTWSNVWRKTGADYRGPKTEIVDIPSAALQNNVMIRFHYYNANYDWWWQIDDVKISGASNSCRQVTLAYDACESGSFIPELAPPSGKERILVTSASSGESSYFVNQGSVSFSNFFWTNVFNGSNVKAAFDQAKNALTTAIDNQTPLLNDGSSGTLAQTTYIGNGSLISGTVPTIADVSDPQSISGIASAVLTATGVEDSDGIARVWAVILPPNYATGASNNPVNGLPSIDLMPTATQGQYQATYDKFNIADTYNISIYAKDRIGNTSMPMTTTVTVGNPLRRRAIIVAGVGGTDVGSSAIEKGAVAAYNALTFQKYPDDDIYFVSPVGLTGVDGSPSLQYLESEINSMTGSNTYDMVMYMVGNGDTGTFEISGTETLSATQLYAWLNSLQGRITGKVTVIYDANYSGSFNSALAGANRILIGSSDGEAYFLSDGDISFSNYFWKRILNGQNVRDAFYHARSSMEFSSDQKQKAQLDDNGNGTSNESSDGTTALNHTIGVGIRLAGNDPMIGSVVSPIYLAEGITSATIWADNVTTTGTLASASPECPECPVWAVITAPESPGQPASQTILPMSPPVGNRYQGTYSGFTDFGRYAVTVYAKDSDGNMSTVSQTTVYQLGLTDNYEEDDTYDHANVIILNSGSAQQHNFHDNGDVDWVKFYAFANKPYTFSATKLGARSDVVMELYDEAGVTANPQTPLVQWDNAGRADEIHPYTFTQAGFYYLKLRNSNPNISGYDTGYDLSVYIEHGNAYFCQIDGIVKSSTTGLPIAGATVTASTQAGYTCQSCTYTTTTPPQGQNPTGYYYLAIDMEAENEQRPMTGTKTTYNNYGRSISLTSSKYYYNTDVSMVPANTAPTAEAGGPYAGTEGQAITLNGSGSYDTGGSIAKYEWDVDNNGTYDYMSTTSATQGHTYTYNGTYTIRLRVTDNLGLTNEDTAAATIANNPPAANFTGSPTSETAPLAVTFTNSTTGGNTPFSYAWDFDNSGSTDSTLQNPSYTYYNKAAGDTYPPYAVKLTVTDYDGDISILTKTSYISVCYSNTNIVGSATTYTSLQSAYNAAATGNTIQARDVTIAGDVTLNRDVTVTIQGGYDCYHTTNTGKTIINGNMTIGNPNPTISYGKVTIENGQVQVIP